MTIAELIHKLMRLDPSSTIYLHDSYYDTIESFGIEQIDNDLYLLPEGATPVSYCIKWKSEKQ